MSVNHAADAAALACTNVPREKYYHSDGHAAARLAAVQQVERNQALGRQVTIERWFLVK